jgi:hypothetical protein
VLLYIASVALFMKAADWISVLALAVELLLLAGLIWYCFETREMRIATQKILDLTQQQLGLLERQTQRQQRIEVYFDLTCKDGGLWLRVSNLGLFNFLLQTVHVRRDDKNEFEYEIHTVVDSGKTESVLLRDEVYQGVPFGADLELTLVYLGLDGSGRTPPKCFNVFLGIDDSPDSVIEGLDEAWAAWCPICNVPVMTNVYDLKTFAAAEARRAKLTEQVGASCPRHESEWTLTNEQFRKYQDERRSRQKIN